MKVLMFGWEFPPHNSGGLGVACQGLARALSENGVSLTFVLPKRFGSPRESFKFVFADIPDCHVYSVNTFLMPYQTEASYKNFLRENGYIYGGGLFEEVERYSLEALKIAKRESFDIIHAHDWLSFGAGIAAKRVSGKPLIAHVHATEIDRTAGNPDPEIFKREREGIISADKVFSVSEFTKKMLVRDYGVNGEKIKVVHNGLDQKSVPSGADAALVKLKQSGYQVVLFAGRITVMKGVDYLVKAAKRVVEYAPRVLFVIAGSGDMEEQIMQEVAALGLSKNFIFTGFLRGEELSRVYNAADLFVSPSVSEPFGLTSLEALAHGTPVIMSKQSGASEVLTHAMKVDYWDTEALADKILSVLEHGSLREVLTANGQRDAFACSWDKAAKVCIDAYKTLDQSYL